MTNQAHTLIKEITNSETDAKLFLNTKNCELFIALHENDFNWASASKILNE